MRRFRNIPPLQYLLGFEAAARLASFGRAAEELGLTQSAISHQMRLLEDRIGQALFMRQGRSVCLTDAGRDYQRTVAKSLGQLEDGYRRLEPFRKPGSVVIYSPRDFASRWLMPRLHLLREAVPNCDPWIDTSGAPVDFEQMEVSIAISRCVEPDPALLSLRLVRDMLTPVMSPRRLVAKIDDPIDLLNFTLLHVERTEDWNEWFAYLGIKTGDISPGIDFSDSDIALSAAERGLGIALGSMPLAAESLAAGVLIKPIGKVMAASQAWFATTTPKELAHPVTQDVWAWLKHAADPSAPGAA